MLINEPILPNELIENTNDGGWHQMMLKALADQLGVGNDFYYPLIDVMVMLAKHGEKQEC